MWVIFEWICVCVMCVYYKWVGCMYTVGINRYVMYGTYMWLYVMYVVCVELNVSGVRQCL